MSERIKRLMMCKTPQLNDPRWKPFFGSGKIRKNPAEWSAAHWIVDEPREVHVIENYFDDRAAIKIENTIGYARIQN